MNQGSVLTCPTTWSRVNQGKKHQGYFHLPSIYLLVEVKLEPEPQVASVEAVSTPIVKLWEKAVAVARHGNVPIDLEEVEDCGADVF